MKQKTLAAAFLFSVTLLAHEWLLPRQALSQESFFQGKTITIIQGRDPGGSGDLRVRALVPFLEKYISANPKIVMEFMPGEKKHERRGFFGKCRVIPKPLISSRDSPTPLRYRPDVDI